MGEQGLVVDSRFRSRKSIVADLSAAGIVDAVIEAKSVNDGLDALSAQLFRACFLGPSLSEPTAADFVQRGRQVSKHRGCAFIAVVEKEASTVEGLLSVGIDGTLRRPYGTQTFVNVVNRAISQAKERVTQTGISHSTDDQARLTVEALNIGTKGLVSVLEQPKTLRHFLYGTSLALRTVSRDIAYGQLRLRRDGTPSIATRDAIRLALEKAFPPDAQAYEIGSASHSFITALVDWFSDRIQLSHSAAGERLRQALLAIEKDANSPA